MILNKKLDQNLTIIYHLEVNNNIGLICKDVLYSRPSLYGR